MSELKLLLETQARWQKTRRSLSWAEKIHLAEQVRTSVAWWRSTAESNTLASPKSAAQLRVGSSASIPWIRIHTEVGSAPVTRLGHSPEARLTASGRQSHFREILFSEQSLDRRHGQK